MSADGVEVVYTEEGDLDLLVDVLTATLRDPIVVDAAGENIRHPLTLRCPYLGAHAIGACHLMD